MENTAASIHSTHKIYILALISGILFGLGLAISQMINPLKVLAFLDITGNWDPSLALVMGSATGIGLFTFHWVVQRSKPILVETFHLPTGKDIDFKLIIGAATFGVGWGIAGYCPGPGIAALTLATWEPVIFVVSVLVGSLIHKSLPAM